MITLALAFLTVGWSVNMVLAAHLKLRVSKRNEIVLAIAFIATIISAFL